MKIVELSPTRIRQAKCSAKLSLITREFWNGRGRPQNEKGKSTCDCFAKYKINGRYFCRKHGSLYVLDKLIAEEMKNDR